MSFWMFAGIKPSTFVKVFIKEKPAWLGVRALWLGGKRRVCVVQIKQTFIEMLLECRTCAVTACPFFGG